MGAPLPPRTGERGAAVILFVALIVAAAIAATATMMVGRPQFAVQQGTSTGFDLTALRKAVEAHAWVENGGGVVCPDTTGDGLANDDGSGTCAADIGAVPWRTIGVTERQAQDAWGNYISVIRAGDGELGLVSMRDGAQPRCDFILISGGTDSTIDTDLSVDLVDVTDSSTGEDLDIAVCGRLAHARSPVEASNVTTWGGNSRADGTADDPVEFKPQEVRLGDGSQALVMGNPDLDEDDKPRSTSGAMPRWSVGCSWLPVAAWNDYTSIDFRFQFFPGETAADQHLGTGHGFTVTLLPSSVTIGAQGNLCGGAGENLGHGGIDASKVAVEFDIYSGETGNPGRNHVAALLSTDSGTGTVSTNVQHGQALSPGCTGADCPTDSIEQAWLEVPNCNIRDHHSCDMERVDWYAINGVDPQDETEPPSPVYATKPYKAEVMVLKRCGSDCALCGEGDTGDRLWIRAEVSCDLPSALASEFPECAEKVLNSCQPVPAGDFSRTRFGFTYATGEATTGLQISNIGLSAQ